MSSRWRPTDEHRLDALQRLLSGLAHGDDATELTSAIWDLHPRDNTFPGEVFLALAADAMDLAGIDRAHPIGYEGLREQFLPELSFRGRENRKIQFAILAASAARGGLEPDLLDEVVYWQTDDFWTYGLAAAVALIRASADRVGQPVDQFAAQLAQRHGLNLEPRG